MMKKLLFFVLMSLSVVSAFAQTSKVQNDKKAKYNSIYDLIRNQPGVFIHEGGATPRIIIRGIGTNSDATDPLFMVDGVKTDDISYIIPEDVWSVEVVKDGSASFYGGMEGANGVILITTNAQHDLEERIAEQQKADRAAAREARKAARKKDNK